MSEHEKEKDNSPSESVRRSLENAVSAGDDTDANFDEKETAANNIANDFPDGGFRAWGVAFGAAGISFCSLGYCNAFGVYQDYYLSHQLSDETPTNVSWIGSLQIFFLLAGYVVGGPLFDRFGSIVIYPGAVIFIFTVMMTSLCTEYYQFMLCQGLLGGVAMGSMTGPAMAAVGQYFRQRRGLALGVAVAGSSLGGVLFPIALNQMFSNPSLGFGWTIRIIGFWILGLLGISCPLVRARLPPRQGRLILLKAFNEVPYDLIILASFLMLFGTFTPIFFLPEYAREQGMSVTLSYYTLAILNASSLFGRLIPGYLADRVGRLNVYSAAGIITGIMAICWQKANGNAGIIVFAAIYGFFSGAIVSMQTTCMATVPENPSEIGAYLGQGMFIAAFATLAGPPLNGLLVTNYGGFDQAATMSGIIVLAGGILILGVKVAMARYQPEKGVNIFSKS